MRNLTLAVAATAMAIPVTFAVPTTAAVAQYDRNGNYVGRTWRGADGRYYCRRGNGTNRTTGTVVGAVAGALIGREVQRSRQTRHCR